MNGIISWIHFGDLHINGNRDPGYQDFLTLIEEANGYMSDVHFALLPGDNADDGAEDEYSLVEAAVKNCRFPVEAITGDHDMAGGSLDLFRRYLDNEPYRSISLGGCHFMFLNSVAEWKPPVFGLGRDQLAWLERNLEAATDSGVSSVVFMHAYPSEHSESGELQSLFRKHHVVLVEMGHTHYNELANDGHSIYATTRSTGQVEEGPPGFSVTSLDQGVVSWNFRPIGQWPFVMITSPADHRLMIDSQQSLREHGAIRARIWGPKLESVILSTDEGPLQPMEHYESNIWMGNCDFGRMPEGLHRLTVTARTRDGRTGTDQILAAVGDYHSPSRCPIDYDNDVGAWPEKHIPGTQLGPNENGRHWPPSR